MNTTAAAQGKLAGVDWGAKCPNPPLPFSPVAASPFFNTLGNGVFPAAQI